MSAVATSEGPAAPPAPARGSIGATLSRVPRGADLLVFLALAVIALVVYLPHVDAAGWYIDDWSVYDQMQDAEGSGPVALFSSCQADLPAGRPTGCVYHALMYGTFGGWVPGYHLVGIALTTAVASLFFVVLRLCRLSTPWAAVAALVVVTFPGSDSTRLWPVAGAGQWVLAIALAAVVLGILALRVPHRGRRWALHAAATALFVYTLLAYEVVVPIVLLAPIAYLVAVPGRRALGRGAVDLGMLALFFVWRFVLSPVPAGQDFVVDRTFGQQVDRAQTLLLGAWNSFTYTFANGRFGPLLLLAAVLIVLGAALLGLGGAPSRFRKVVGVFTAGVVVAALGALSYQTAHDLYVPQVDGTFNRLNLVSSLGYALVFTAIVAALFAALQQRPRVAAVVAAGIVVATAWHQAGVERNHQEAWAASWQAQQEVLAGLEPAVRGLPETAAIVTFDHPAYERGWIPVFATTWDLRGAISYETPLEPPVAVPLLPDVACGPTGVTMGGDQLVAYDDPAAPLYFVSPARREAKRVAGQVSCKRAIETWGRPPFWGRTMG